MQVPVSITPNQNLRERKFEAEWNGGILNSTSLNQISYGMVHKMHLVPFHTSPDLKLARDRNLSYGLIRNELANRRVHVAMFAGGLEHTLQAERKKSIMRFHYSVWFSITRPNRQSPANLKPAVRGSRSFQD